MAACLCGADVRWVLSVEGKRVRIDAHDSYRGPGRYRVLEYGTTWLVEPIGDDDGTGHFDHRLTCSALSDAERARVLASLRGDEDAQQEEGGPPEP